MLIVTDAELNAFQTDTNGLVEIVMTVQALSISSDPCNKLYFLKCLNQPTKKLFLFKVE